jgi:RND family efflux transporter MFP subunit
MNWIKKNKKIFVGSLIVYAILAGLGYYFFLIPGIKVDAFKVSNGVVLDSIKETGTATANHKTVLYGNVQGDVKVVYFQEGDIVKKGDLIISTDEDAASLNIQSMREQAGALSIQLEQARKLSAKSKILFQEGAISQTEYDNIVASEKQLAKQLQALNFSIASASASAQSGGFVSPMDGVITELYVKENNTIQVGAPVIEISDLSNIFISTSLVSSDADSIKVGAKVIVTNDSDLVIDDKAIVSKIGVKAHDEISDLGISQKRVTLEISPSNIDGLRLGSDVQLEITVNQLDKALRVDNKALFQIDKMDYVYVIKGKKAVETQVKLGIKGENYSQILSGVLDSEMVILSPDNAISNGSKVKIINQF